MLIFIIGLFVGTIIGIIGASLIAVSRIGDDIIEKIKEE